MSPEQQELVDRFLTSAADSKNTVDIVDVAQSAFAMLAWALSRAYFPADQRDLMLATFSTALSERVAELLREQGHRVEFMSLQ